MYNIDKKDNVLEPTSHVKVITHADNKSSFHCPTIKNLEWVFIIKVIFANRKKVPIYIIFKRLDIKPIQIEFIKNIGDEAQ